MQFNKYLTELTDDVLKQLPLEVLEQLIDCLNNIPFIKRLTSPDRPYAKDLPRDDKGRIVVDITNPHILEDMDYFRLPALHFMLHGCYTFLRPNSNPNSEYRKYWDEEIRRCREGYVRESDGEWVTGLYYWFLNYCPMLINEVKKGTKTALRKEGFPLSFEGTYWRFHYLDQAKKLGKHCIELAKRQAGKSFSFSAIMSRNLLIGESEEVKRRVITVLTAYLKEYLDSKKDGTLNKFLPTINFLFANTPFPRLMLKNSPNDMTWQMGYKDEFGIEKGSLNQVIAVSAKDSSDKLRGKRALWILFEEMGAFAGLLPLYDVTRQSVEDGEYSYGVMYLIGTANNKESDFTSAKTLLYSPTAYRILALENVFDKANQGKSEFGFFFPAYINRTGCYNNDGVSDVTAALIEILMARYKAKYSADPRTVLRIVAENPITPAEAIIKVKDAFFPVAALTERLCQIDQDPAAFNDVYVGDIVTTNGRTEFKLSGGTPIRTFHESESEDSEGAIEIFNMPEKDSSGKVYCDRYIIGVDPVDNDQAESNSLYSCIVLDLFTDKIVAEFTGRKQFADDNFEITRLLCLFYNAKCLHEAHPYDLHVKLPDGTTRFWGDIKVGDTLFAPNGKTVKVIGIPIDGEDDIYKITFSDGREVEASSSHIWEVYKKGTPNKTVNMTTEELILSGLRTINGLRKFFVPEGGKVEYLHLDTIIDPYTLGLLIAKGIFTKFTRNKVCSKPRNIILFSSPKQDIELYKTIIPYPIKYTGTKEFYLYMYIDNIDKKLENLDLLFKDSHSKFIPEQYLYNDSSTRMELLKGLMDGNGHTVKTGINIFVTASRQLSEDIKLLCRSLGIKCFNQKSEGSYRIAIITDTSIFKLPRKIERQYVYLPHINGSKTASLLYKNGIEDITYVGRKKCKCVTVDSEDGLYLIGDYVVTHNCNKKGIFAYFSKMNSTHLLKETPEYLRDKQLVKYSNFGSNAYGVNASAAINNYANRLIRDWLLKPVVNIRVEDGNEIKETLLNLQFIRNRALLRELIEFSPEINVDRVRALGMVMLYREEKMILYNGNILLRDKAIKTLADDPFFVRNYDNKFGKFSLKDDLL